MADITSTCFMPGLARILCFAAIPLAFADTRPAVTVQVRMESNGELVVRISSARGETNFNSVLADVVHCPGRMRADDEMLANFRCSKPLKRDGLALQAVVDLSPIARQLAPSDEIQLLLDYPRLGFESTSVPLTMTGIQFGYRDQQWPAIYLPLAALALALMLIAMGLARAGLEHLHTSILLLGTIIWLATVSRLQAADPIRILLSGTPFSEIAAMILTYCGPLLVIAIGAASGSRTGLDQTRSTVFSRLFWTYGMILFPLTAALSVIPETGDGNWLGAAPWLVFAVLAFLVCRWRIRAAVGATRRQLSAEPLQLRIAELAAKAGYRDVKVYLTVSSRSKIWNAFALPRKSIMLTAPLVESLTKREVDAIAAHELSHFGQTRRNPWIALVVAAVLFQTPLAGLLIPGPDPLLFEIVAPLLMFFWALHAARKREFVADAGAVKLTGDAQALISGLVKISRHHSKPLDFSAAVEWLSSHPSTRKRIRAMASQASLDAAEVEQLCSAGLAGECYTVPQQDAAVVFTPAWQAANAGYYGWSVLAAASGGGLLIAWLLDRFAGAGLAQLIAGVALGCALTKIFSTAVVSANYARLKGKLACKLGVTGGQLMGLAPGRQPGVYNGGYRFADLGLLWFDEGRLRFLSEQTTLAIDPADVVEIGMVSAAPMSWRRMRPIVRFRDPVSQAVKAFILHPVEWGASSKRLWQSIEQWKASSTSGRAPAVSDFQEIPAQPFQIPTIAQTVRACRKSCSVTLVGAMFTGWMLRGDFWPMCAALAITACSHAFIFLPAISYRPPALPRVLEPRAD
jgi:Zn-dependent protease with chaperone function